MRLFGLICFSTITFFMACSSSSEDLGPKILPDPIPDPVATPFEFPTPAACGYDFTSVDTDGWKLKFEDNFSKDLSEWTIWKGGAYNNELQLYKAENLTLKDGYLFIHSKKEAATGQTTNVDPNFKSFEYTSGRIESNAIYGPTLDSPVRIVARIQQPKGEGLWSAFWTYNDPWPTKGEIDIMEYRGGTPRKFQSVYHYGSGTNLQTNANNNNFFFETKEGEKDLATCFYVYELEWAAGLMTIKVDGKVVHVFQEPKNPFVNQFNNKAHRIILNLAVGGDFFAGLNKADIPNDGIMIVDWVKVYTK